MIYLHLFHGRKTPDEQLDDWGADGPVFGPLRYVHTTYATHVHLAAADGEELEDLTIVDEMVYYDGMYYGDWSVFDGSIDRALVKRAITPDPEKVEPPKREVPQLVVAGTDSQRTKLGYTHELCERQADGGWEMVAAGSLADMDRIAAALKAVA